MHSCPGLDSSFVRICFYHCVNLKVSHPYLKDYKQFCVDPHINNNRVLLWYIGSYWLVSGFCSEYVMYYSESHPIQVVASRTLEAIGPINFPDICNVIPLLPSKNYSGLLKINFQAPNLFKPQQLITAEVFPFAKKWENIKRLGKYQIT